MQEAYDNSRGRILPRLMRASQPIIEHIKGYEKLRLRAYDDGYGNLTIGWGHTEGVSPGDTCTEYQASEWLRNDIRTAEAPLFLLKGVTLYQYEYDALVALIMNIGTGKFMNSTLRRALELGRYDLAADEFPKWRKASGKVSNGLVRRRKVEERIFRTGKYNA